MIRKTPPGLLNQALNASVLAVTFVLGSSNPSAAGTCIITFHDYPRWAAAHGRGGDPAVFCRSFAARYRNGTCRAVRYDWSRAQCDDYRRREAAYVKRVLPSFSSWLVVWKR